MRSLTPHRRRCAAVAALACGAGLFAAAPASAHTFCLPTDPPPNCTFPGGGGSSPAVTVVTLAGGSAQFDWGNDHQQVSVAVTETTVPATGARTANVRVTTRTWTDNVLQGFHATSWTDIGPVYFSTSPQRYGVDGKWINVSDRTDVYDQSIPVAVAEADRGGLVTPHAQHS